MTTIKGASLCAFSDRTLAIDPFTRLNEGTKHGVDARLVAFAVRLKPFEDIAIETDMNVLLGGRQAYSDLALPIIGQRPFVPVASRSTSVRDIALTRFQSVLLSPRATFRLIWSAEKRDIFSLFRISCSPERDKSDGVRTFGPYDSEEFAH
ncbi:MAG: hypothetical protein WAU82_08095 [Candidatus Binatus sp.]